MHKMAALGRAPCLLILLTLIAVCNVVISGEEKDDEGREVYVVYLGAPPAVSRGNALREKHLLLLASVLPRFTSSLDTFAVPCHPGDLNLASCMFRQQMIKKLTLSYELRGIHPVNVLIRTYKNGFSGFTARLTNTEALNLRQKDTVVSVFIDPIYQLHTTRSWDFLDQTSVELNSGRNTGTAVATEGSDTIVGLLDTGIWPESKSFDDEGFSDIPSRWKGLCMSGTNFSASNCNKKLIGAKFYQDREGAADSPRDWNGHGTHTASTAAGNAIGSSSYYGLAAGTAKGGSTSSRIAMYRVCSEDGCAGSALLAGFDDAIADGVDILSVSIGASGYHPDFSEDPIAIGAFHAVARGITVVCSAGNDGPQAGSVVNAAPWILTVAASTIDRKFESDVLLGGNTTAVRGGAINFSNLNKSPEYPLTQGSSAKSDNSDDNLASHCELGTLDGKKVKGKIVLCEHNITDTYKMTKIEYLKSMGAVGAVLVNDLEKAVASNYIDFPVTEITSQAASDILKYINSNKNPVATIAPTVTISKYMPAPVIAYFSSRGPSQQTSNILKPDVSAPGANILASWIPTSPPNVPMGQKPLPFNIVSGTSMSCPHVAGIAATIKTWNPDWSPAAIRSAIMTTTTQLNSEKAPITVDSGSKATPYDYGAGEVSPTGALEPGLIYELGTDDYLQFLCNYGYASSKIQLITSVPDGFKCPTNSSKELISNLNYPSIAVSNFTGSRTVTRTLTVVGSQDEATYEVSTYSPACLSVKVVPDKLKFTKNNRKLSFQVIFSAQKMESSSISGSITWSDGAHRVRSPFVVSST